MKSWYRFEHICCTNEILSPSEILKPIKYTGKHTPLSSNVRFDNFSKIWIKLSENKIEGTVYLPNAEWLKWP